MKILHTSDLQLDAPFKFLGTRGRTHRQQLRETFASILEKAESDGYDILLIAGDLFDSNNPSQRTLEFVIDAFQQCRIPICILPGKDHRHRRVF